VALRARSDRPARQDRVVVREECHVRRAARRALDPRARSVSSVAETGPYFLARGPQNQSILHLLPIPIAVRWRRPCSLS